jgi:hypothetical protein
MSYCHVQASCALLIVIEYILSEVVMRFLSVTQCAPVRERKASIYLAGSILRSDRAEVQAEVECDFIKRSHILSSWTC